MKKPLIFNLIPAKTVLLVLISLLLLFIVFSCKKQDSSEALDSDTSYAFGMLMANQMNGQMGLIGLHFDYNAFMEGFRDYNEASETRLTQEQAVEKINLAFTQLMSRSDEDLWMEEEKNRTEGDAFLAENSTNSGVITTSSGLQYEVITIGSGRRPGSSDMVMVNYEGSFIDGSIFESTFNNGDPAVFSVGGVIQGWSEGLQLMREGSVYQFFIPADLAYGSAGNGPIPPGSTLIFKVELLSILENQINEN